MLPCNRRKPFRCPHLSHQKGESAIRRPGPGLPRQAVFGGPPARLPPAARGLRVDVPCPHQPIKAAEMEASPSTAPHNSAQFRSLPASPYPRPAAPAPWPPSSCSWPSPCWMPPPPPRWAHRPGLPNSPAPPDALAEQTTCVSARPWLTRAAARLLPPAEHQPLRRPARRRLRGRGAMRAQLPRLHGPAGPDARQPAL